MTYSCLLPSHLHFCRLSKEDLSEVAILEKACFSLPWSEQELAGAFMQDSFFAFGLREVPKDPSFPHELIAYISVYHTPDELEILNIAVRKDRRGQGYGHVLLGLVLRTAEKTGIVQAVLEVRVNNIPAIRLYERFGFSKAGLRRGYYPDTGEDAIVYTLAFPCPALQESTRTAE